MTSLLRYILRCRRCGEKWSILASDADAYHLRIEAGVCWDCEPEGW